MVVETGSLVDRLVQLALKQTGSDVKTLVGHRFPDDDVWFCLWLFLKFVLKTEEVRIVFVNAGETLPGSEGDPSVFHFDTGAGEYDQHASDGHKSSAAILIEKLGLNDQGLKPLLDMVNTVDTAGKVPFTSIHFAIEGYARKFWSKDKGPDWQKVQERVFELFDIIYNQETRRIQSRENLPKYVKWVNLVNGVKVADCGDHPEIREAAFDAGAMVVIWTQPKWAKLFYTGIQVNTANELRLHTVAEALRYAEARERGIDVRGKNLSYLGRGEPVDTWFLHNSLKLILNGSKTWTLKNGEFTRLSRGQIVESVCQALVKIPANRI